MPVLISLGWFVVPWAVRWVLPKFIPGIEAMQCLVLSSFFLAAAQIYLNFLLVIRKRLALFPMMISSTALAVLLNWYSVRNGYGLVGIAGSTCAAMWVFFTMVYVYASRYVYPTGVWLRNYGGVMARFIFMAAVLAMIHFFVRPTQPFVRMLVQWLLFIAIYTPFMIRLERRYGLMSMVRQKFFGTAARPAATGGD